MVYIHKKSVSWEGEKIMLHFGSCPVCGKEQSVRLDKDQEDRFLKADAKNGADVNKALPELSPATSAFLFSGICEDDFTKLSE
jgi:hypothetical protein